MACRFAWGSDELDCWSKSAVALNQFEQTALIEHAKGMALIGSGIPEGRLHFGIFPVGATEITAGVREGWNVCSIAFDCSANVVVEVGMGDDEVGNVSRTNAFLVELIKQTRWGLIVWR